MDSFIVKKIKRTLAVVVMFALLCNTTVIPSSAAPKDVPANSKAVTVTVSGNGEARLNVISGGDVGSVSGGDGAVLTSFVSNGDVEIIVKPDETGNELERNYIKALVSGGDSLPIADKYASCTIGLQKISEDKLVHVDFGKEYAIKEGTIINPEGGNISISQEWVDADAADKNVTVSIIANAGYRVESVAIGSESHDDLLDETWSKTVEVTQGTLVDVTFVPVYTIKAFFDVDKGQTTISGGDAVSGDVYTYKTEDGSVEFVAKPAEHYRVSEVKINSQDQQWEGKGKNGVDSIYTTILEPIQDYEIEVTFALDRHVIRIDEIENAKIYLKGDYTKTVESYEDEYGEEPVFVIVPEDGYHVCGIEYGVTLDTTVSCGDLAEYGVVENAEGVEFKAPAMEEDYILYVNVEENAKVEDDLAITDDVIGKSELSGSYYTLHFTDNEGKDVVIQHWATQNGVPYVVLPKDSRVKITANTVDDVAFTHLRINEAASYETLAVEEGTFLLDSLDIATNSFGYGTTGLSDVIEVNCNLILTMDDGVQPEADVTPSAPNNKNCYNDNVVVSIDTTDGITGAGIQSVTYWVMVDGEYTQGVSFEDENNGILYEHVDGTEICTQWDGTFTVDAEKNNSSEVKAGVIITDCAGNVLEKELNFDIDITAPIIEISYDNNDVVRTDANGQPYFNTIRNATIVITERTNHFEAEKVNIVITARDAEGKDVTGYAISGWVPTEGETPDEDTHRAVVTYASDANYTFEISYVDMADNQNVDENGRQIVTVNSGEAPFTFTVDTLPPTGTITATVPGQEGRTWEELNEMLSFGYFSSAKFEITGTQDDATSPIYSVEYYKVSGDASEKLLNENDLEALPASIWAPFGNMSITANEQFVIYLRITDYAGNYSYISSQGMIADNIRPGTEANAPVVSVTSGTGGVHGSNVTVNVNAVDPEVNQTYSGLKVVNYQVLNGNTVTQSGSLFNYGGGELKQSFSGSIPVDAKLNNSNDVQVLVTAEDNAGNISTATTGTIMIDVTVPSIDVSYDNNAFQNETYYQDGRVATIAITERNFSESDAVITVTSEHGNTATLSGWSKFGEGDNTVYRATVAFSEDDDYTLGVSFKDMAGNVAGAVNYASGTTNPESFTVDTTLPVIDVEYEDEGETNVTYFNKPRTAIVTITEHNFDESFVNWERKSSLDGTLINDPEISWSHRGDVHKATIVYDKDGDYRFDVSMQDVAGNLNYGVAYAGQAPNDFTIDQTIEKPIILGVKDGTPYSGDVSPSIKFGDLNLDSCKIVLERTNKANHETVFEETYTEKDLDKNHEVEIPLGMFEKAKEWDGIYRLTITMVDKAGNPESEDVIFTVNRYGSVFEFTNSVEELNSTYVQEVMENLVITAYSPTELVDGATKILISRDGAQLENIVFTIKQVNNENVADGENGWYQYEYTIDKSNFAEAGVYRLAILSEDENGVVSESISQEDGDIIFSVDTEAPEITSIVGLESDEPINDVSHTVKYEVFDAMGLKGVIVKVNGNVYASYTQDDFTNPCAFEGEIILTEGVDQTVQIIVEDLSGRITDSSEPFEHAYEFYNVITVTTDAWVLFYKNKPLFYGAIGGSVAVIFAAVGFVVFRKKRKEK